jgi:hypothetical protein
MISPFFKVKVIIFKNSKHQKHVTRLSSLCKKTKFNLKKQTAKGKELLKARKEVRKQQHEATLAGLFSLSLEKRIKH